MAPIRVSPQAIALSMPTVCLLGIHQLNHESPEDDCYAAIEVAVAVVVLSFVTEARAALPRLRAGSFVSGTEFTLIEPPEFKKSLKDRLAIFYVFWISQKDCGCVVLLVFVMLD